RSDPRWCASLIRKSASPPGHLDRFGRHERLEEGVERDPLFRLKLEIVPGGFFGLAAVQGDGLFEGLGAAVVEIRAGITEAPERRRAPFLGLGGGEGSLGLGIGPVTG